MGTKKNGDATNTGGDDLRWHASSATGVLYRDHPERKYGRRSDRYLAIRYRSGSGKRNLEALGWASEGWTLEMAANLLHELKQNIRSGERPQSLKEKREMQEAARAEEARIAERVKLKRVTFGELAETYRSWAKEHRLDASIVEGLLDHHILPVLGPRVAHEITTADLQALGDTIAAKRPLSGRNKNNKEGRLSPQTVLHALKVVRETFNYAKQADAPELLAQCFLTGRTPLSLRIVDTVESAFKRLMPADCACSMTGRLNLCWVMKGAGTRTSPSCTT